MSCDFSLVSWRHVHFRVMQRSWAAGTDPNNPEGDWRCFSSPAPLQACSAKGLNGKENLADRQWLFIFDAIIPIPIGIWGYSAIPDHPRNTRAFYLTKEKRIENIVLRAFGPWACSAKEAHLGPIRVVLFPTHTISTGRGLSKSSRYSAVTASAFWARANLFPRKEW